MPDRRPSDEGRSVPSSRLARLARIGSVATGIAGGMLLGGARQIARGKRPALGDLLLTPANALRLTQQLARLRGAAMKVGQLLSMDAGDLLPREFADILARLRAEAQAMPEHQLRAVLDREWGHGWQERFDRFVFRPIAAASIGQVHRAHTRDGRDLAIKVQYPGVRESIDSDVDNVAMLVRLSGLLPPTLDVAPALAEAKRQLHEEADYVAEGAHLARFAALLAGSPDYLVPDLHTDLTTARVLAMSFVGSAPVESLVVADQAERDRVARLLIDLVLRELFELGLMQTDPNFANYRYDAGSGRVVLLDFGATRAVPLDLSDRYRALACAALAGERDAIWRAAADLGFVGDDVPAGARRALLDIAGTVVAPLRAGSAFDFGDSALVLRLRNEGFALASERSLWRVPPVDTLFIQRKLGGVYMLASRLRARVDVAALLAPHLA